MQSISTISFDFPTETARSNRNALLKELYEQYTSQPEVRQKENRKRYYAFLRLNHRDILRKDKLTEELWNHYKSEFRKSKLPSDQKYIEVIAEKNFWYFFSHIPTEDLNFIISCAKDVGHRGGNVASFIMGSRKSI